MRGIYAHIRSQLFSGNAEDVGYAMCLDKLVNTTGDSNLCFKPLEPRFESRLHFVWKKYQIFSKATEKFLQQMLKETKKALTIEDMSFSNRIVRDTLVMA